MVVSGRGVTITVIMGEDEGIIGYIYANLYTLNYIMYTLFNKYIRMKL